MMRSPKQRALVTKTLKPFVGTPDFAEARKRIWDLHKDSLFPGWSWELFKRAVDMLLASR
jgi:hypothetical protein